MDGEPGFPAGGGELDEGGLLCPGSVVVVNDGLMPETVWTAEQWQGLQ